MAITQQNPTLLPCGKSYLGLSYGSPTQIVSGAGMLGSVIAVEENTITWEFYDNSSLDDWENNAQLIGKSNPEQGSITIFNRSFKKGLIAYNGQGQISISYF